jgi:hypothetical protein
VRTVIVEDASRFARELVTQELGIIALTKRGVRVLTANGDRPLQSTQTNKSPRARVPLGVVGFLGSRFDGEAERQVSLGGRYHPHPYDSNGRKSARIAI